MKIIMKIWAGIGVALATFVSLVMYHDPKNVGRDVNNVVDEMIEEHDSLSKSNKPLLWTLMTIVVWIIYFIGWPFIVLYTIIKRLFRKKGA